VTLRQVLATTVICLACVQSTPRPTPAPPAAFAPTPPAPRSEPLGRARDPLDPARTAPLRAYIRTAWDALTRGPRDLPRAAIDPKAAHVPGTPWPVYVAAGEDRRAIQAALVSALSPEALRTIDLRRLPAELRDIRPPGLLYLPRPYVVPGGRFNEMYGWDSYFIVLGLLDDGRLDLARDMADNLGYEVAHYGGVLNANRTYYLTRSQPPLFGSTVMAVFRRTDDRAWLAAARPALEATYKHWTSPPHLVATLGLSRYFDHGAGPAPEVVAGERDAEGRTHYDRVRAYYRTHAVTDYPLDAYYDRAADQLTPLFFVGDRSMRESGFDPSDRFGRFGVDVIHYLPVCLNTLLYRLELELAEVDALLGDAAAAGELRASADRRHALIDRLLWDEGSGLYLDYDFETNRRRDYPFATTFWPLAVGLASPAQARRVRANLPLFERPGGIMTSTHVTGSQWDAPFGWAPLQLFAVQGLRRAGYAADATRVARAFLSMLVEDFERRGTLVEKYDVERRTSEIAGALQFGYGSNEIGFGWTNGVALELLSQGP
jgi:alpha,alpha-trehalase